jgi:hypothetical protein
LAPVAVPIDDCSAFAAEQWRELRTEEAMSLKTEYKPYRLQQLLHNARNSSKDLFLTSDLRQVHPPSPKGFCEALITHVVKTTAATREYTASSGMRLATNYRQYPGKMDHSTVLCFTVGYPSKKYYHS